MAEAKPYRTRNRSLGRGGRRVVVLGGRSGLTDLYHGVLRIPVGWLFALLASVYLALNLIFASLYLLDPGGVSHLRPHDFADAFFFSVQTVSTVGYGGLAPADLYANLVVTLECFMGLVLVAVTTGVIFARVSRPTARVIFSQMATIALFEGKPHLMFRAINERTNQILEAEVSVNLTRTTTTAEGREWRRFQDLAVTRGRTPLFALSWTIMHPLDEVSPLYGATPESLAAEDAVIVVLVSGVDDVFAQRVHARHEYAAADIVWDREFENVLTMEPDGRWVLDVRKFHHTRDAATNRPH